MRFKVRIVCFGICLLSSLGFAKGKTKNLILVTLDGLRIQEMFRGADPTLINKEVGGVEDAELINKKFMRDSLEDRREALFPFVWRVMAKEGQIFGNQEKESIVKVSNPYDFSYPGYNEILTGVPDTNVNSNSLGPNPNVTVFEWLNAKENFQNHVAAFGAWEVFNDIFNRDRSHIFARAGKEIDPDHEPLWPDEVSDSVMFDAAFSYFKATKPRLFFLGFGETDDWAHQGRYDNLLLSANYADRMIQKLWQEIQNLAEYKDQTTLIVTTDHGRGTGLENWKNHNNNYPGSENIWIAVMGPDTPAWGERIKSRPLVQAQIANTISEFLGEKYGADYSSAAAAIDDVMIRKD